MGHEVAAPSTPWLIAPGGIEGCQIVFLDGISGVTTGPGSADPAMRGGDMGAQKEGTNFFTENLTKQFSSGRSLP